MSRRLFFLYLSFALLAAGCSAPRIDLVVASQPNVNPDYAGRPSPVIVKMYEMRNELAFKQGDSQMLFERPMQALGADLIAADELVFIPGEAKKISYQPSPYTHFVGLVAGFRQMERAQWRVIRAISPQDTTKIGIELNDASMILVPDHLLKNWDAEETVKQYQQSMVRTVSPQPDPFDDGMQRNSLGDTLSSKRPMWHSDENIPMKPAEKPRPQSPSPYYGPSDETRTPSGPANQRPLPAMRPAQR